MKIRMFTIALSLLLGVSLFAQDFYDLNTIQTIEITFAESNWDALLDAQKNGDEDYIMAQSVTINGEVLDSVGVKYKGNSTYSANQVKNPFHIELDTYKDHDYDGYTDIKLSNAAKDPSFIREVLSYSIIRQYMDAPLSNYANVYVNGTLLGLYSNSEAISKKFVSDRFDSKNNTFVKCNPIDGAGPGTSAYPNLVYIDDNISSYSAAYELKSDDGWSELIDLCDTLANHVDDIESILDVNRTLWMLALDNMLVNLDSYIGGFTQNYYLYRDDHGRFLPVIWDLNESFGRFAQTGTINLNSTADKQQMSHLLHSTESNYPLVKQLLSVPTYKRMYLAHCKTILLENFDNDAYYETGQQLQETIDASVKADGNKFFTYNNFLTNLNTDITSTGGRRSETTVGITSLMNGRSDYLLALSDFTQTEPAISDISYSTTPIVDEVLTITASISNATNAILAYRDDADDVFVQYPMYDDGNHNDGAANDGVYGAEIMATDNETQYYIYAENANAGMFSPRRAEHEFYIMNANYATVESQDLVINELLASNDYAVADQDGEYDDWIELYNNSASEINLEGYSLSDNYSLLTKFTFTAGAVIPANGYLMVWADKDTVQTGWHANFKLSSSSETLFLSDASGTVIDEISFSDLNTDDSYGRYPNGVGDFRAMAPTFGTENDETTSIETDEVVQVESLSVYPNPVKSVLNIEVSNQTNNDTRISIYNLMGRVLYDSPCAAHTQVDVSQWAPGMYVVSSGSRMVKVLVE